MTTIYKSRQDGASYFFAIGHASRSGCQYVGSGTSPGCATANMDVVDDPALIEEVIRELADNYRIVDHVRMPFETHAHKRLGVVGTVATDTTARNS